MIRLAKSTYTEIKRQIDVGRYTVQIDDEELGCDICRRIVRSLLDIKACEWYLCSPHAREVGVLW